jgi:hypothetical protein
VDIRRLTGLGLAGEGVEEEANAWAEVEKAATLRVKVTPLRNSGRMLEPSSDMARKRGSGARAVIQSTSESDC